MWRKEHRETHRQSGHGFPSDLTDAQWARLEPLIPPAKTGGRPRQTDMRAAMNAIFYLLRTGCPWRYLPGDPFPPRSTVYNILRKFQREGVWERMWEGLLVALREQWFRCEPRASPSDAPPPASCGSPLHQASKAAAPECVQASPLQGCTPPGNRPTLDYLMNANSASHPGMPRVDDLDLVASFRTVCLLVRSCTIPHAATRPWAIFRPSNTKGNTMV
jgi:transposase